MKQTMRRLMLAACVLALVSASTSPLTAQIPDEFTNLQVLDREIGKQQLIGIMKGWSGALGVRCNHCHVGPDNLQGMDFATDEKEHKRAARAMLKMVINANSEYMGSWEEDRSDVTRISCYTCHRGQPEPPRKLTSILSETVDSEGVDAAMAQYKELKAEHLGEGLYDFRERTFGELAQQAFEGGDMETAMQILDGALEIYPESADLHAFQGMAMLQIGDATGAAAKFDEALRLDPDNVNAQRGRAMLERGQ